MHKRRDAWSKTGGPKSADVTQSMCKCVNVNDCRSSWQHADTLPFSHAHTALSSRIFRVSSGQKQLPKGMILAWLLNWFPSLQPRSQRAAPTPSRQIPSDWLAGGQGSQSYVKFKTRKRKKESGVCGGSMKLSEHFSGPCWQDADWDSLVISFLPIAIRLPSPLLVYFHCKTATSWVCVTVPAPFCPSFFPLLLSFLQSFLLSLGMFT